MVLDDTEFSVDALMSSTFDMVGDRAREKGLLLTAAFSDDAPAALEQVVSRPIRLQVEALYGVDLDLQRGRAVVICAFAVLLASGVGWALSPFSRKCRAWRGGSGGLYEL